MDNKKMIWKIKIKKTILILEDFYKNKPASTLKIESGFL